MKLREPKEERVRPPGLQGAGIKQYNSVQCTYFIHVNHDSKNVSDDVKLKGYIYH